MYAFARDGGIPGHRFFHKVDIKRKSPIRTVWLACTLSFLLGLPSLGSAGEPLSSIVDLRRAHAINSRVFGCHKHRDDWLVHLIWSDQLRAVHGSSR
jgi:hypothetical protein